MAEFTISNASPIHFRIETGVGTINAGSYLPENYLYPDIQDFYNCSGPKVLEQCKNQKYQCDDVTDIQVYFDSTGIDGGLVLNVYDDTDTLVDQIVSTDPFGAGVNYLNFNIDWSNYDCPGCYQLVISSYDFDTGVPLNWADNGTFEDSTDWSDNWVTGGSNTKLQSTLVFNTGLASGSIVAPLVPTATEGLVLQTGSATIFTFVANTVYRISMYVYDDSVLPFTQNGHQLRIDVNGLTDGTIIDEVTVIPSVAGRDAWHEITTTFKTGTDITGRFDLVHETTLGVQAAPQAQGIMFTDTHTLSKGTYTEQATSEGIDLQQNHPCTVLVEYYGSAPQLNNYFDEVSYATRFRYREDIETIRWIFEDEDQEVYRKSDGSYITVAARPEKVYQFGTGYVAPFMAQIIGLSTLHDTVFINNIQYVRKDGGFSPEWLDHAGACKVEFDMKLYGYDYDSSLCN